MEITITTPNTLYTINNTAILESLGAPSFLIVNGEFNRTRMTADAVEPFLKGNEKFEDCTFEGQDVCHMHLHLLKANFKKISSLLDDLVEKGVITSYAADQR